VGFLFVGHVHHVGLAAQIKVSQFAHGAATQPTGSQVPAQNFVRCAGIIAP